MPVMPAEISNFEVWKAVAAGLKKIDSELSFMAVPTWPIPVCLADMLLT